MLGTHKITVANAGGPRQLAMRTLWAARVAQFWQLATFRAMTHDDVSRIERELGITAPSDWHSSPTIRQSCFSTRQTSTTWTTRSASSP